LNVIADPLFLHFSWLIWVGPGEWDSTGFSG
jgi:hypothetical protein